MWLWFFRLLGYPVYLVLEAVLLVGLRLLFLLTVFSRLKRRWGRDVNRLIRLYSIKLRVLGKPSLLVLTKLTTILGWQRQRLMKGALFSEGVFLFALA